jgi:hypothetical protein
LPEWLIERGIGETRAILVHDDGILAARVVWDDDLRAGTVLEARLATRVPGTRRGAVRLPGGAIALIDGLDPALAEGAPFPVRVTRAAIAERGRTKLAHVKPAPGEAPRVPDLAETLRATGHPVRVLLPTDRSFDRAGWADLVEEAMTGEVAFPGGTLTISPTPAMTLIDIDGPPPVTPLALAAVPAVVGALARLDIAGSVGVDFPTLPTKADRQAVDAALETALAGWKGERTAVNGFGFVQLVSRLEGPSLVARFARRPAATAARALLRQAEHVGETGALLLTAAPAVRRALLPEWEAELVRRTGRIVRWNEEAGLALYAGFAQAVAA